MMIRFSLLAGLCLAGCWQSSISADTDTSKNSHNDTSAGDGTDEETDTGSYTDADSDADTDSDTDADSDADSDSDTDSEADTGDGLATRLLTDETGAIQPNIWEINGTW